MSMKINRFEKINVDRSLKLELSNRNSIMIKDHKTDNIISHVQLCNDKKRNAELADRIIMTIEDFLSSDGDATENQH